MPLGKGLSRKTKKLRNSRVKFAKAQSRVQYDAVASRIATDVRDRFKTSTFVDSRGAKSATRQRNILDQEAEKKDYTGSEGTPKSPLEKRADRVEKLQIRNLNLREEKKKKKAEANQETKDVDTELASIMSILRPFMNSTRKPRKTAAPTDADTTQQPSPQPTDAERKVTFAVAEGEEPKPRERKRKREPEQIPQPKEGEELDEYDEVLLSIMKEERKISAGKRTKSDAEKLEAARKVVKAATKEKLVKMDPIAEEEDEIYEPELDASIFQGQEGEEGGEQKIAEEEVFEVVQQLFSKARQGIKHACSTNQPLHFGLLNDITKHIIELSRVEGNGTSKAFKAEILWLYFQTIEGDHNIPEEGPEHATDTDPDNQQADQQYQEQKEVALSDVIWGKGIPNTPPKCLWKEVYTVIFAKLISNVFPVTDFQHEVVSPALFLLTSWLEKIQISSLKDIQLGIARCSLLLEYVYETSRFCSVALLWLLNVLATTATTTTHNNTSTLGFGGYDGLPVLSCIDHNNQLLYISKNSKVVNSELCKLSLNSLSVNIHTNDLIKMNLITAVYKLLTAYVKLHTTSIAFPETFGGMERILQRMQSNIHPHFTELHSNLLQHLTTTIQHQRKHRNALIQHQRPIALPQYEPYIEEDDAPETEEAIEAQKQKESRQLKQEHKQELKQTKRLLTQHSRIEQDYKEQEEAREKDRIKKKVHAVASSLGAAFDWKQAGKRRFSVLRPGAKMKKKARNRPATK